jgi:hypothetical protein
MIHRVVVVGGVALLASALLALSRPIEMLVDGERVDTDVAPVTTASEKVFVPLRSIADALGAQTEVEGKGGAVNVVLGSQSLRLHVGENRATLNGMPFTFKHAPFRVRGRVMVSLDAVSRALHVHARYDPRNARIDVITPGIGMAPSAPNAPAQ